MTVGNENYREKNNLIFLIALTAFAIYSVIFQGASLFFIIYLFWFDELIRTVSRLVQIKLAKEDPRFYPEFSKYTAQSVAKSQLFFLLVYAVFIVVVFGLFFYLLKDNGNEAATNIQIFVFRNLSFNVCIMLSMVREFLTIRIRYRNRWAPIVPFSLMSGHLLTLHLSILLGGVAWALTSGEFKGFHLDLGEYNKFAIAFPFFLIKFLVDLHQINHSEKQKMLQEM